MWTPRRILLGLFGMLAFAAGYFGYSRFLGSFDGLPPLPAKYLKPEGLEPPSRPRRTGPSIDRKLELAFGLNCPEITYPIKIELKGRRVLVASREFHILKVGDRAGWVEMLALSLASFGEKRGTEGIPEINTLYADIAYLRFDKPIRAVSDLSDSKIAFAELHADPEARLSDPRKGRIKARNNRRTIDLNDDIEMVTPGPVYYEDQPKKGQPHIYTFTTVHVTDHLNTGQPEPNYLEPRDPTIAGVGLRVYLTPEDEKKKKDPPKKDEPRLPIPRKDPTPGVSGVELLELDHAVEMNLWTDADSTVFAPGGGEKSPKKEPKKQVAKGDPKKDAKPVEKRLLQVRTNGPFRYDMVKEIAHFEKPAVPKPGLIEHVVVTRAGRSIGQDMLDCEYLDVQFQRKKPVVPKEGAAKEEPPPAKKDGTAAGDGDLEIRSIRAWGETVVMTSDSENLHATCFELTHDAEAHVTVLKGTAAQPVQAVKEGNLIRGSEMHLFGDGNEINQGHVLGAGSVGFGELDPKTGEYLKQAFWTDRLLFTKVPGEKDKPAIDVLTFLGKDGIRAEFRDTSGDEIQKIEAMQLKVWLKQAEEPDPKKNPKAAGKKPAPKKTDGKKEAPKSDSVGGAKPTRLEATTDVRSSSPEMIIKHSNYLEVDFRDVEELIKPPAEPDPKGKDGKGKDPKAPLKEGPPKKPAGPKAELPPPRVIDPKAEPAPKAKDAVAAKEEPVEEEPEEKKPLVVVADTIHAWVNRDPKGRNEMDHVDARGDVHAHQDPANKDDLGTDIAGKTVFMQAYKEGNRLVVTGVPGENPSKKHEWGVVRFDKLTMFGFEIVIDQRDNTSTIPGEGSMEIISSTDSEGKKLEQPTTMTIYWKHRMDFLGADKLIYYHGAVQGYQEDSRLKCEWMQVLLDRPVYLNQDMKPKTPAKKKKPGDKKDSDSPNIDTVMCYYAAKDETVPKPRIDQPVIVVQEEKENGKLIKSQIIRAPDVTMVNTPLEPEKGAKDTVTRYRKDITATASDTMPGEARIWQPGQKDVLAEKPPPKDGPPKKKDVPAMKKDVPPKKKSELDPDQEMQLTVVQFGGKMVANDFRKRAKFYKNIRTVHLPADSPTIPVDLREGDIPVGAVYLECRDTLDVFSTEQMEKNPKTSKMEPVSYQEMIAIGNVRVRKQGEFFGDADQVTYSELKGTMTFHGTLKNPATLTKLKGQGVLGEKTAARIIKYHLKDKTVEEIDAVNVNQ